MALSTFGSNILPAYQVDEESSTNEQINQLRDHAEKWYPKGGNVS